MMILSNLVLSLTASFHRRIHNRLITKSVAVALLASATWNIGLTQNCNPNGGTFPSCIGGPGDCTAADLQICPIPGYIADANGNPITSCTPGEQIQAQIFICVRNNASSAQNGIRISATLDLDGQSIDINDCFADEIPPNATLNISIGLFSFTCGACVSFEDFILGYNTNAGCQCADVSNPNGTFECPAKCQWIGDLNIPPLSPLDVTCPADVTVECLADTTSASEDSLAIVQGLIADCDPVTITLISRTDVGDCGTAPGRVITRTFQITDGTTTLTCTRTNTILDQTPPSFTCPGPLTGTCLLSEITPYPSLSAFLQAGGTATDNCELDPNSFMYVGDQASGLSCPTTYTRTYSVADLCGNVTICTQQISIDDQTPPMLNCPADLQFSCMREVPDPYADLTAFETAWGSATDNCGVDRSSFSLQSESSSGTCPLVISRIYEISDLCGNVATCTQIILVDDQVPPELQCPGDLNFSCMAEVPAPYASLAALLAAGGMVDDNCGIDATTFSVDPDQVSRICPTMILRTYRIQDSCQNEGICTQEIIVHDQSPPMLDCPSGATFQCLAEVPQAYADFTAFEAAGGSVSDNCGIVAGTFVLESEDVSTTSCPTTLTRTYSIEDSCGNLASCTQTFVIDDTTAPTMDCPGDIQVQCASQLAAPYADLNAFVVAGGMVDDNCGIDAGSFAYVGQVVNGTCPTTIVRTYSIADICGNQSSCTQTITILDQTPPELNCPADLAFECIENVPAPYPDLVSFEAAGGSAADNCGIVAQSFSSSESRSGSCPIIILRTYTITDGCGTSSSCVQTITVHDQTAPSIGSCPTDVVVGCVTAEPELTDLPAATATLASLGSTDNCSATLSLSNQDFGPEVDNCSYVFTRRYYVTDECGNQDSCDQQFFYTFDTVAPEIIGGEDIADITIGCFDAVPAPPNLVAVDACVGAVALQYTESSSRAGCLRDAVLRTWTATDACGNTVTLQQLVTREDLVPPVLTRGADTTIYCGQDIPENMYDIEDDCSSTDHEFREEIVAGSCACDYTILRIWEVSDHCNTLIDTQFIYVRDTTPPDITLTNPMLIGLEYGDEMTVYNCDIPRVLMSDIEATDCCGILDEDSYDEIVAAQVCETFGYYRRWRCGFTVTDLCGNVSEFIFYVNQYDTVAPEFVVDSLFQDHHMVCGEAPPPKPEVSLTDNCADAPRLVYYQDTIGDDPERFAVIRTWEGTDGCGNARSLTQTISYCGFDPVANAASIGNSVWHDADGDGIQDAQEEGVNGTTVQLYYDGDFDGEVDARPIKTSVTRTWNGKKGIYLFENLNAGMYQLEFLTSPNFDFTSPSMGTDATRDSDVDPETGRSPLITVDIGEKNIAVDAGLTSVGSMVTLVSFSGESEDCQNRISWVTANEINYDHWTVERSDDGNQFRALGRVGSVGQGDGPTHYSYVDQSPLPEGFYRLKGVSRDGEETHSQVIEIKLVCRGDFIIQVFPNPTRQDIRLSYEGATNRLIDIQLVDPLGKTFPLRTIKVDTKRGQIDWSMDEYPPGLYWLRARSSGTEHVLPIIKLE